MNISCSVKNPNQSILIEPTIDSSKAQVFVKKMKDYLAALTSLGELTRTHKSLNLKSAPADKQSIKIKDIANQNLNEEKLRHELIQLSQEVRIEGLADILEIEKQVLHLLNQKDFSLEDLKKIFEMENQLRTYLAKLAHHSALEKFQRFLEKFQEINMKNLINKAKQFISHHPIQFSIQAAATQGDALGAAIDSAIDLLGMRKVLCVYKKSVQQVYIKKPERGVAGAVFKKLSNRSKEEEILTSNLFRLMTKRGVIGSFQVETVNPARQGFEVIGEEEKNRGYKVNPKSFILELIDHERSNKAGDDPKKAQLFEGLQGSLLDRLLELLEDDEFALFSSLDHSNEIHERYAELQWCYFSQTRRNSIPFDQIKAYYENNFLDLSTELKAKGGAKTLLKGKEEVKPLWQWFRDNDFCTAYDHESISANIYIFPYISSEDDQEQYQEWEKLKWAYQIKGEKYVGDFKEIQTLVLCHCSFDCLPMALNSKGQPLDTQPNFCEVEKVLESIQWGLFVPEIIRINKKVNPNEYSYSPLKDITVKRFVHMSSFSDLTTNHPNLLNVLMDHISPESEVAAVISGEVQVLDLHASNVGFKSPWKQLKGKQLEYNRTVQVPSGNVIESVQGTIETLLEDYLKGLIDSETILTYKGTSKEIKKWPTLYQALERSPELVFFDLDLSGGEDNELQVYSKSGVRHILHPLNSYFLELPWKDKPLSAEAIFLLTQRAVQDEQVKKWMRREDAPIRQRLSAAAKKILDEKLEPILKKDIYSLSYHRAQGSNKITLEGLQVRFEYDLIRNQYPEIWQFLQEELSKVTVAEGETWESLAKRYQQDINTLKALNTQVADRPLTKGQIIKIECDLFAQNPESFQKKSRVARQLFPRATWRQQQAQIERMTQRQEYLDGYQSLKEGRQKGSSFDQCAEFLASSFCPLSTLRREALQEKLEQSQLNPNLGLAEEVHDVLLKECVPTYFNIMCAMYPWLADVYYLTWLNTLFFKRSEVGARIGNFKEPLDVLINEVINFLSIRLQLLTSKGTQDSDYQQTAKALNLAQEMYSRMQSKKNPSYFGDF